MKMKEIKEKSIKFVKENKGVLIPTAAVAIYGLVMYGIGMKDGNNIGTTWAKERYADDIRIGEFTRDLENQPGQYTFDRFVNENRFNGKMNSFNKAVELLSDPENTKNVTGIIICRKEND